MRIRMLFLILISLSACENRRPTGKPNHSLELSLKTKLTSDLVSCGIKPVDLSSLSVTFAQSVFISNNGALANGECLHHTRQISINGNQSEIEVYITFVHESIHCLLSITSHDDTHINLMSSSKNKDLVDAFRMNHPKKCEYLNEYF